MALEGDRFGTNRFETDFHNIGTIVQWMNADLLISNNEYQRDFVWTEEKQVLLIESLLKNYPIPSVFTKCRSESAFSPMIQEIVDGKQRLFTIRKFVQNELDVRTLTDRDEYFDNAQTGYTFSQLNEDYRKEFLEYKIAFVKLLDHWTDDVVRDIFARLQYGTAHSFGELLHARWNCAYITCIKSWARPNLLTLFWTKRGPVRKHHLVVFSQLLHYELESTWKVTKTPLLKWLNLQSHSKTQINQALFVIQTFLSALQHLSEKRIKVWDGLLYFYVYKKHPNHLSAKYHLIHQMVHENKNSFNTFSGKKQLLHRIEWLKQNAII